jgi:hypothetical protein
MDDGAEEEFGPGDAAVIPLLHHILSWQFAASSMPEGSP